MMCQVAEVQAFIHEHFVASPTVERTLAAWALETWRETPPPLLYIVGGLATGKTRLLNVLNAVCSLPLIINSIAGLEGLAWSFDTLNPSRRRTLLLDEPSFTVARQARNLIAPHAAVAMAGNGPSAMTLKVEFVLVNLLVPMLLRPALSLDYNARGLRELAAPLRERLGLEMQAT